MNLRSVLAIVRRALDWFVPPEQRADDRIRDRRKAYVIANLSGCVLGLSLLGCLSLANAAAGESLRWLVPLFVGFGLLPFGLRLLRRFELVAVYSAQYFVFVDLVGAYFYGGLVSPAIPWLCLAFATPFYYLAHAPRWRYGNLALQTAQIATFVVLTLRGFAYPSPVSNDTLLVVSVISAVILAAQISLIVGFVWSVAQAKQAELARELVKVAERDEALRRSHDTLHSALSIGRMGISFTHLVTGEKSWSPELYKMLEYDPATTEPTLENYLARIHPDDRALVRARSEGRDRGGPIQYRVVLPSGELRWFRGSAAVQRDETGTPATRIATIQDITESKRLEDELRHQAEHLRRAQRTGRIGSAIVDVTTGAAVWSEELFRIYGLPPDDPTPDAAAFLRLVHPDDRDKVDTARARNYLGTVDIPLEFRIVRPDGEIRWLRRDVDINRNSDGTVKELTVIEQDITDLRRMEDLQSELEHQLAQAQKMEAVGQLTGGVAHDFNNLLAVILGRLQMLDEELADRPELRSWVQSCLKAVDRGASLTKSMLVFSRSQQLSPVELDLSAVVADIEDMVRRTLGATYELAVAKAADLWRVEADPGQLQNALLNLVLNARDAMPKGGVLTIATANQTVGWELANAHPGLRSGEYAVLSVTDTGVGIAPEILPRVFDPFFTTKNVGEGTGLGLSMVYGFVTQSGGHVTVDSVVGKGTTVRLYLPRKDQTTAAGAAQPAEIRVAPKDGGTILVIEDNDEMRDLTRSQLERRGFKVLEAPDGPEALHVLRENPGVDLLLCDVVLPHGMSGPEVAREARALQRDLRVLFMSGYNEEQAAFERLQSDIPVRLLQKPFRASELIEEIRATLAWRGAGDAAG